MGNIQAGDKQQKPGKSPAKSKNFIKNLNRKSPGRDSKKHARKKSETKRGPIDREFDKTPDSDNNELIDTSDNDTVESIFKMVEREGTDVDRKSVHSQRTELTVPTCLHPPEQPQRSTTREPPECLLTDAKRTPTDDSDSVFTDPLTPLGFAAELNQCYYSAESDSAHEDPARTLTPTGPLTDADVSLCDAPALVVHGAEVATTDTMPHNGACNSNSAVKPKNDTKEEISDVHNSNNDSCDKSENEKVMGSLFSVSKAEELERITHECNHEFKENRLKACPGQTSFTLSKHKKVELSPAVREVSLLDNSKCFLYKSQKIYAHINMYLG